jgi:hypothetical protein
MKARHANIGAHTFVYVVVLMMMLGLGRDVYAVDLRLSLDPHAATLRLGARFLISGYDAPLRLPANGDTPEFSLGFTIPNDYEPNTPLKVIILWESPSTRCDYILQSGSLFRARDGQPRDFGDAAGGLEPVSASTTFTILPAHRIRMEAAATAHQTASVRFDITPTPGEFPTLQSGDAVVFAIGRRDDEPGDTCNDASADEGTDELGIAGVSIVYERKRVR